jgi:FtsP/CotA-like multicopper oxidase with cupredoxin domain
MNRREMLCALGASAITGAGSMLDGRATRGLFGVPSMRGDETFNPDVELELVAAPDQVGILAGARTDVWRFTASLVKGPSDTLQQLPDSYLGPVIRLRRGQRVRVRFQNRIPEPSIVHWHGLDVPDTADGHPRFAINEGATYVY